MAAFRYWIRKFLISTVIVGLVWSLGLFYFVSLIPDTEETSGQSVDVAIVLTGGSKRVEHGFGRVAEGLADKLFISGVNDEATPEHIIKLVKQATSVPNDRITLGYKARSTVGNALEASKWIEQQQVGSIRLITANYHMPRSLHEFAFMLPKEVKVIADPVFPKGFDISDWLVDSNSRRLVMSEYHKYIASHLRHLFVRIQ